MVRVHPPRPILIMNPVNLPPRIVSAAMLMKDGLIVPGVRHYSKDMRNVLEMIYGKGYHLLVKKTGIH